MLRRSIVLMACCLLAVCSAQATIPQTERNALVALYYATGGPSWQYCFDAEAEMAHWLPHVEGTECDWWGVDCDGDHVVSIELRDMLLTGATPPEMRDLTHLVRLDLGSNRLTGIAAEIGELASLAELRLAANQLTSIPPEIGMLDSLLVLELDENLLAHLPPEIGNLTQLVELSLVDNQLSELPAEIADLESLVSLFLGHNDLTSLPTTFGDLGNLQTLYLDDNQLSRLPAGFGDLDSMVTLDLSLNQLSSLPAGFGSLESLVRLNLNWNRLGGLPADFGSLANLYELDIYSNRLTSLPAGFGNLAGLSDLQLSHNELTSLPAGFGNLASLRCLELSDNRLTCLPDDFGDLGNLESLYLSDNQLTSLPPGIVNLDTLYGLFLSDNRLTSLPAGIGSLAKLVSLYIDGNQLTVLPPEIAQLSDLTRLELGSNLLTSLPPEIGSLGALRILGLESNQLADLPRELWYLDLFSLNLAFNRLTTLPPEIGNLDLRALHLDSNRLTSLPPEIAGLGMLEVLGLDNNCLTDLPPEFADLHRLKRLRLAANQLSGELPDLRALSKLQYLALWWNGLQVEDDELAEWIGWRDNNRIWIDVRATQTVPPDNIDAVALGSESALVSWAPVAYTAHRGGYRVYDMSPATPMLLGETADKTSSWLTVTGLDPGAEHALAVRTVTYPHPFATNSVVSAPSQVVTVSTAAAAAVPGEVQLVASDICVAEGETREVLVRRVAGVSGQVTVEYATSTGSGGATPGRDFVATAGTLTWAPGDSRTKVITLTTLADHLTEGEETLQLLLRNPAGGAILGSPSQATVRLQDSELSPRFEAHISGSGETPRVAIDSYSNRLVVWTARSVATGYREVRARCYRPNGEAGASFTVSSRQTGDQHSPAVAMAEGRAVVVWVSDEPDGSTLLARVYDQDGSPVTGETRVDQGGVASVESPQVVWGSSGIAVAWIMCQSEKNSDGSLLCRFLVVAADLLVSEGLITIDDGSRGPAAAPALSANDLGDMVIAWERARVAGGSDVIARRLDRHALNGDEITVNREGCGAAPNVAIGEDARFTIAWQQRHCHSSVPDGWFTCGTYNPSVIYTSRFSAQGKPGEAQTYGIGSNPRLAMSRYGSCILVWQRESTGGGNGVICRPLPDCEDRRWANSVWLDSARRLPDVVFSHNGEATVVYSSDDVREGDGGILGSVFWIEHPQPRHLPRRH